MTRSKAKGARRGSRAQAIRALKAAAKGCEPKPLTERAYEEWREKNEWAPDLCRLFQLYADWRGACLAAGLPKPRGSSAQHSLADVGFSMNLMRARYGTNISQPLWERERRRDPRIVSLGALKRLFGSQVEAAEHFGMTWASKHPVSELADAEIAALVRRVCERAGGGPLTVREYTAARDTKSVPPDPHPSGLLREWGERGNGRWPELMAAAGYPVE